jgi:hypothetical protein
MLISQPMNIPKHVIDKKIHANFIFFNVKWILKDKNLQQSHHLKLIYSFNALH